MPEYVGWGEDTPLDPVTGTPYPTGEPQPPKETEAPDPWRGYGYSGKGERLFYKPSKAPRKIIGLQDAVISPAEPGNPALNVSKFDTTSYLDRAVVQLENDTGGDSILGNFAIKGKIVWQLNIGASGKSSGGYILQYTDYGDVEKNGEKEFKIGNDFIFTPAQVEDIFDFYKKELTDHDMYTIRLPGIHPYFGIKDLWTLSITHSLPSSTSEQELIDIDVQICGVNYERRIKEIGETLLSVRVPSGAWSKTTSRRAKLAVSGLPNQNLSRTTEVTVASRDFAGQADYHCDGTNDEVEIQAAIDYVGSLGGGRVILTPGIFNVKEISGQDYAILIAYQGITLCGCGYDSTRILFDGASVVIDLGISIVADDFTIHDLEIYSSDSSYLLTAIYAATGDAAEYIKIHDIKITGSNQGININSASFVAIYDNVINVSVLGIGVNGTAISCYNNIINLTSDDSNLVGISSVGEADIIKDNIITLTGDSYTGFVGIQKTSGSNGCNIIGNKIIIEGTFTNTTVALAISIASNELNANVSNNNIQVGGTITINTVDGAIRCDGDKNTISNNTIAFTGTLTINTGKEYIGIYIPSGADDNMVNGNMVIGSTINCAGNYTGIAFNGARDSLQGNITRLFVNSGTGTGRGIWTKSSATVGVMVGNVMQNNDTNWTNDGSVSINSGNLYT